jgi:hypothetical protein
MRTADSYRKTAAELKVKAGKERSPKLASELENLARCYLRLAEQADTNSELDLSVEFGPKLGADGEGEGA